VTHYALKQFETAVQRGDVTSIRALWPQIRKQIKFEVVHGPITNLPLNQE